MRSYQARLWGKNFGGGSTVDITTRASPFVKQESTSLNRELKATHFLVKLAPYFLALPYSLAAVEKAFSQLKNIKNENRNFSSNETLKIDGCQS